MQTNEWISMRSSFPSIEKKFYDVRDCRHEVQGKAYYNGWDWEQIRWNHTRVKPGFAVYERDRLTINSDGIEFLVTHWKMMSDKEMYEPS